MQKRNWPIYCLLLLCVLWLVPHSQAQSTPPDLESYTQSVREALAAARRNDRLGLEASAAQLIATTELRLEDGTRLAVDNRWLEQALNENPPDIERIAARLGALTDALAQPTSKMPKDALEQLQRILAAPPYAQQEASAPPSWLLSLLNWLGRLLEALLRPIANIPSGSVTPLAWCVLVVGVLMILAVLLYLLRGVRAGMLATAQVIDPAEEHITSTEAVNQATLLARAGDYRMAMRYLYLTALLRLDERKLLRYDRALTNREYLLRSRENPALRAALEPVIETFDRVWYGHAALDETTFQIYWQQVEKLGKAEFSSSSQTV